MKIFLLPSKSIYKLHELPTKAGVYYVTAFWLVFYVGQAKNLRNRWRKNHQRYNQFKLLAFFGRLHYKTLPISEIGTYEKAEILRCKPFWNNSKVPDFFGLLKLFLAIWLRIMLYSCVVLAIATVSIYLIWFL
jgi:hypothetical protein